MFFFIANNAASMLITFAVNLILLYLTLYARTPRAMRPYAVIIRIHIFADLISETANFITSMAYVAVGDVYLATSLGILQWRITPNALRIVALVYNWLVVYEPISILIIDFVYRFRTVVLNRPSTNMALYAAGTYLYSLAVSAAIVACLQLPDSPQHKEAIVHAYELMNEPIPANTLPAFAIMYFKRKREASLLFFILCCIWLEYAFIIYVSLKVRSVSASMASAASSDAGAARAYETHRAVSRILVAHALLPLLMSLPVTLNIGLSMCGFSIARFVPYLHATLVWLAPIKTAVTICCVPAYRATLLRGGNPQGSTTIAIHTSAHRSRTSHPRAQF